uniref:tRNA-intron lyase n=1 Tax=Panagrellus redivivus TaxID=6233 RepID=A0A7E4ZRB7_PANRE
MPIKNDAVVLLEKFEHSDPIAFKKLPYEFQNRLVALLPHNVLMRFTLAGKNASKSVKLRGERRRETFSNSLILSDVELVSQFTQEYYKNHKFYDVLYTSYFRTLSNYYISRGLYLISNDVETFDHAVKIVSGTYRFVDLRESYTWRQAIHLMNVSNLIKFTYLRHFVQLEVVDYDEFFEAVVQWFLKKKSASMFHMVYQHLDASFRSRFEAVIKARTKLNIHFLNDQVVVYKTIQL